MSTGTLEAGLYAFLSNNATITALVKDRIYPLRMPDAPGAWPVLVYHRISGARESTHTGNAGFGRARVQLSCWADSYAGAKQLALAVVQALHNYLGPLGNITKTAVDVENEIDLYDPPSRLYHVPVDVLIQYQEPVS